MREKKPITNSKLKAVDTKNPEELRKSLRESGNLSRLSGGKGHTEAEIEEIISLHCDQGLPLEESIFQVIDKSSGGILSKYREKAEKILDERTKS